MTSAIGHSTPLVAVFLLTKTMAHSTFLPDLFLTYRSAFYLFPPSLIPLSTYSGFAFPWNLEYLGLFTKFVERHDQPNASREGGKQP